MKFRCPNCHRVLKMKRKARTIPQHHLDEVHKTYAQFDGESEMVDVVLPCPWSGAKFKVIWRP